MSFMGAAMWGVGTAGSLAKGALLGGTARRMAIGGVGGGLYGAMTNDRNDAEGAMGRVARMAFLGAGLGAGSRLLTPSLKNGKLSGMPLGWKAAGSLTGGGIRGAMGVADKAATAVGWSLRHPLAAGGIVGGAYALGEMNRTPYDSPLAHSSLNQPIVWHGDEGRGYNNRISRESAMLDQMNSGVAPMSVSSSGTQMRHQRLQQSTFGLTQGLHSGRHG